MVADCQVGGVVLAAGLARRFGREKLLEKVAGRPLGAHALAAALASPLDPVVLVTRPQLAPALIPDQAPSRLRVIVNPKPQAGQSLSLKLGLEALGPEVSHLLALLADQPLVGPELLGRFVAAAEQGAELAAIKLGRVFCPPTLFGRVFFPELMSLQGDQGGRALLARHQNRVQVIDPGEDSLVADVNRPEDIDKIKRRLEACV